MDNTDTIIIKKGEKYILSLNEPYANVEEIESIVFKPSSVLQNANVSFRWSTDGVSFGDWKPIPDSFENINCIINPDMRLWFEFLVEAKETIEIEDVTIDVATADGYLQSKPLPICKDPSTVSQAMIFNQCTDNIFNPYQLSGAYSIYYQLSAMVNNMFGFCVRYYKTAADQRSRDVILKEYSLENVIAANEVKILIPNNEFPTREVHFNPMMINYNVEFEVQIVKSAFQAVFGQKSRPEVHDYLYFETYLNRMYEVNSVCDADDIIMDGAYWRVSLIPWQQRVSVEQTDEEIKVEVLSLVDSVQDKFEDEANDEYKHTINPDQFGKAYSTLNTVKDYNKDSYRFLHKSLQIGEEQLYDDYVIMSRYYYKLGSVTPETNLPALIYQNKINHTGSAAISMWVRFNEEGTILFKCSDAFVFEMTTESIIVNGASLWTGTSEPLNTKTWYGVVVNLNDTSRDKSVSIYEIYQPNAGSKTNGKDMSLKLKYNEMTDGTCPQGSDDEHLFDVTDIQPEMFASADINVTSFRLWRTVIEEEKKKNILKQYKVKDAELCLLSDNAQPQFEVPTVSYPR